MISFKYWYRVCLIEIGATYIKEFDEKNNELPHKYHNLLYLDVKDTNMMWGEVNIVNQKIRLDYVLSCNCCIINIVKRKDIFQL